MKDFMRELMADLESVGSYGMESEFETTSEIQNDLPTTVDPEDVSTVIDDLAEDFEYGSTGVVEYREEEDLPVEEFDEELKADIEALSETADVHEISGPDVLDREDDPKFEQDPVPVEPTEEEAENTPAFYDDVKDDMEINEIKTTDTDYNSDDMQEYLLEENGQMEEREDSGITAPVEENIITPEDVDLTVEGAEMSDTVVQYDGESAEEAEEDTEIEVDAEEVKGDDSTAIDSEVATESEDMEEDSEDAEEESTEEAPEEEKATEEESEEVDEVEEQAEEVEAETAVTEEETGEDLDNNGEVGSVEEEEEESEEDEAEEAPIEDTTEEGEMETCCAEERAILDSIEINDSAVFSDAQMEEIEEAVAETEMDQGETIFDDVEEMVSVNTDSGNQEFPEETENGSDESTDIPLAEAMQEVAQTSEDVEEEGEVYQDGMLSDVMEEEGNVVDPEEPVESAEEEAPVEDTPVEEPEEVATESYSTRLRKAVINLFRF